MVEKRVHLTDNATLVLSDMNGNVDIKGWDETDILIRTRTADEGKLSIEETETDVEVSALVSCEIQVPRHTPIRVRSVTGNLTASNLVAALDAEQVRGNLAISDLDQASLVEVYGNVKVDGMNNLRLAGTIYGDATIRSAGVLDLQNIRGNLRASSGTRLDVSRIGGNLQVNDLKGTLNADQVGGNAQLLEVDGACTINRVAGNLAAKSLTSGAKVNRIGGNLLLNGEIGTGCTYHFQADGNAVLRLSEEVNAHLAVKARGNLVASLPLTDRVREGDLLSGILGDGGSEIHIEAKGNVMVGGHGPGVGVELTEEVSRQIEEGLRSIDLDAIGRQVSEEMENALSRLRVKLETVNWEGLGVQARQAVERAMEHMQQDVDRLAQKTARQQQRLEREADRQVRRLERVERKVQRETDRLWKSSDGEIEFSEPDQAREPAVPDLEEERLSILRMVEQGQITPEEAEMLLDALD